MQQTFGTGDDLMDHTPYDASGGPFESGPLATVWKALDRSLAPDSLRELYNGLAEDGRRPELNADLNLAFGFDTNAIFRVGLGVQGGNALDYLNQVHQGPIVIPGQAVQELWNNFLAGVEPKARIVARKLADLESEMSLIGQELGPPGEDARAAMQTLIAFHGDWTDAKALEEFDGALKVLLDRGEVSYVPRTAFYNLALVRKETKTPPGFRDDARNFGDYFLWADFLYGLARADLSEVDAVVMVTNDTKADWSRNSVPHPILVAEARAVSGKDFRLWTVDKFRAHAKKIVS